MAVKSAAKISISSVLNLSAIKIAIIDASKTSPVPELQLMNYSPLFIICVLFGGVLIFAVTPYRNKRGIIELNSWVLLIYYSLFIFVDKRYEV